MPDTADAPSSSCDTLEGEKRSFSLLSVGLLGLEPALSSSRGRAFSGSSCLLLLV